MKVFVSLLTLIGLLMLLGVMTNEVYAPPPPNHYTAFEYAEHVLIGKILSVETLSEQKSQSSSDPNDVKGFMLYEIQIDEFLKNPLETNVIKVPGRYATEENPRSNIDPPYEINQKVLLYIQKDEPNRLPNYDLVIRSDESKVIDESISKPYFLSKSDGQVKHYFPLQQFQSGISFNEIQCKPNLVLIQKYDGTPACVTESTKQKLIERGWTINNKLSDLEFDMIKSNIENIGYDICSIRLDDNTVIIDLNKIFEGTDQETQIISQIPTDVDYEIVYHDGYTDYFINTMTGHSCENLK